MIRTGYSFRTAVGHLSEVASRLEEIGWPASPICDRTSTFGFVRWRAAAKSRVVYGVELAVSPEIGAKRPSLDWWTFLAADDLRPLHELVALATGNPSNALSYRDAADAVPGVIAVAGPHARLESVPRSIPVSLCPGMPRGQIAAALRDKRDLVARPNNRFPRETDRELYRVTMGRGAEVQTWPQWILSDDEYGQAMMAAAPDVITPRIIKDAIRRRDALLADSRAELRQARVLSPERPKTLREMCLDGGRRLGLDLRQKVYRERMDRELDMIIQKKFEDYFFIVADMIQWAKEKMVVGPARGSSCGSLVCYLLDITAIDPIVHGLLFERFIDLTRADLPDIDLDFSDVRRDLVFRYVEEKYGADHVARLGSVMMFKPKSVLSRIGMALRIPSWEIDELSNTVVKRSGGDSRASQTIIDTFRDTDIGRKLIAEYPEVEIASRMEGHPNAAGQHAAGMIITQDPVLDVVAMNGANGVTMCDKRDAESLNLLKIDMLGLTQLSVFERCLDLIGETGLSRFLERIPLDDPAAIDILNQRKFCGVFQFVPGSASANLVTELVASRGGRMESFRDIVDLTAIVRPGPLGSGQTDRWLARRSGREEPTYFHEAIRPHVEETLGVIIYQEQVMQIGRVVGDLTWDDVTALRKAMSKSLGKEYFDKWGDRWKAGAKKRGMDEASRNQMWNDLCQFGMWAFNKSHSVAYATVSYWCLWLKAHHPLEFAAATLDAEKDPFAQITILRELREEGVSYVPIDPDRSTDRWQVEEGNLIGPLTSIRGIGPKKVSLILDNRRLNATRPKGTAPIPLPPGLRKLLEDCKTEIDSLTPVSDAVSRLHPDLQASGVVTEPIPIADAVPGKHRGQVVVVGVIKRIAPLDENDAGRVAKRGGKLISSGPTEALNFALQDDHGADVFCKVGRFEFQKIGRKMVEVARVGKSLYAVKGTIPAAFRMIKVTAVKYLGEMDDVESRLEGPAGDRDIRADDAGGSVGDGDREGDTGGDAERGDGSHLPRPEEGTAAEPSEVAPARRGKKGARGEGPTAAEGGPSGGVRSPRRRREEDGRVAASPARARPASPAGARPAPRRRRAADRPGEPPLPLADG